MAKGYAPSFYYKNSNGSLQNSPATGGQYWQWGSILGLILDDSNPAAFVAANDVAGKDIFLEGQGGGVISSGTTGLKSGDLTWTMGAPSDAKAASAADGGPAGTFSIIGATGGAGDGAGDGGAGSSVVIQLGAGGAAGGAGSAGAGGAFDIDGAATVFAVAYEGQVDATSSFTGNNARHFDINFTHDPTGATGNNDYFRMNGKLTGSANMTGAINVIFSQVEVSNYDTGTLDETNCFASGGWMNQGGAAATITDFTGFKYKALTFGAGVNITNEYGLRIENLAAGTNKYPIYQTGTAGTNYFGSNTFVPNDTGFFFGNTTTAPDWRIRHVSTNPTDHMELVEGTVPALGIHGSTFVGETFKSLTTVDGNDFYASTQHALDSNTRGGDYHWETGSPHGTGRPGRFYIDGGALVEGAGDDYLVSITHTLNATEAAGGTDNYAALLIDLTTTDITGLDTTNFLECRDDTNVKFQVDITGTVIPAGGMFLGDSVPLGFGNTAANPDAEFSSDGTALGIAFDTSLDYALKLNNAAIADFAAANDAAGTDFYLEGEGGGTVTSGVGLVGGTGTFTAGAGSAGFAGADNLGGAGGGWTWVTGAGGAAASAGVNPIAGGAGGGLAITLGLGGAGAQGGASGAQGTLSINGPVTITPATSVAALTLASDLVLGDTINLDAGTTTDDYFAIRAFDTGNAMQEVARVSGAALPYIALGGTQEHKFYQDGTTDLGNLYSTDAAGYACLNEAATTTNPTLCPDQAETDTGIGWASDTLHLIGGGVSLGDVSAKGFTASVSTDSAAVADEVTFGRYEIGVGNTVIALSQETAVVASGDISSTHTLQVRINGATYNILLSNV